MESYHHQQVNEAKSALTDLAERLHDSKKEAVDRVLHRLEKENARRQDKGQRPLTALDPEVTAFVNEATEKHTERATHQIHKIASYVQETTTDGDIQAVALQAFEHAHNTVDQDRSVIRQAAVGFLKGLGDVFSIKSLDLHAPTYQNPSKLEAKVKRYIDQVSEFKGNISSLERPIKPDQIKTRILELAIPPSGTNGQLDTLNRLKEYGSLKVVKIDVVVMPKK